MVRIKVQQAHEEHLLASYMVQQVGTGLDVEIVVRIRFDERVRSR